MTDEQFQPVEVPRDRFGRPMIIPPGGGKPVPYTRCTTYVSALEDTYNLGQWQMRMVAAGLASDPSLVERTGAIGLEPAPDLTGKLAPLKERKTAWKGAMEPLVEEAMDAAKAKAAALRGTEIHEYTEELDRSGDMSGVPEQYRPHVEAFMEATRDLRVMAVEQFLVNDAHRVGGTTDRIYQIDGVDGYVIGDLKTGNIDYGIGKIAMQLAMYANSQMYDLATGARTPIPGLRTDFGIVMDLDIETATCKLVEVDLRPAWEAIDLAQKVRAWRKFATPRNLTKAWTPRTLAHSPQADAAVDAAIAAATSREQLTDLWEAGTRAGTWLPRHTEAAKARIDFLTQAA